METADLGGGGRAVKEVTTVAGLTQSGKVVVVENERIIATDGRAAIIGETTRGYKFK